ncbi:MAG TPA: phosphatase PAP2 family protein [Allosphingosinicella sp.]|nr:phosphatase PAP2 family protein [Allosphingosinicella sp.]
MDFLADWSDLAYLGLNGLSGRSSTFDALVALAIDNNLVKAAPIAAAFLFAWVAAGKAESRRARGTLLVTLASLLFVLAASKTIADSIFLPRPFIHGEQVYRLDGDQLVQAPRLAYRAPESGFSRGRFERLREGEIEDNDLKSFPSDHAAFYFALALGILLANRRAGAFAIAWTLLVICGSRMITGTHSPVDIVAGIGIGGAILLAFQFAAARLARRPLDAVVGWTGRHEALVAALLFLVLFEVGNTLDNARDLAREGKRQVQQVLGL